MTTNTYASTNNQWVCPACTLVSSSKTKPCQFSSVQFSYVALYAPLQRFVWRGGRFSQTHHSLTHHSLSKRMRIRVIRQWQWRERRNLWNWRNHLALGWSSPFADDTDDENDDDRYSKNDDDGDDPRKTELFRLIANTRVQVFGVSDVYLFCTSPSYPHTQKNLLLVMTFDRWLPHFVTC